MKKKIAGIERPYTFYEFFKIIEKIAKENNVPCINDLEYFSTYDYDGKTMNEDDVLFTSETNYGGCEGIYTVFYLNGKEKVKFATAKNLSSNDDTYVNMHIFAAKVCLIANNYVWSDHSIEFNWTGYDVGYKKDGKIVYAWCCGKLENAKAKANEMREENYEVYIRDNATRKITPFA